MKTIIYFAAAIVTLISVGCTKDATYELPVDVAWTSYLSTTSGTLSHTNTMTVNVGDYALFRDASISAVSHEWEVSGNGRIFTDPNDLTSTIDAMVTTDSDLYVLFEGSGFITVTLRNRFESKVTSTTTEAVESVYEELTGLWLFEKTYTIEAYCDLAPGYTIYKIDLNGVESDMLTIEGYEDIESMPTTHIELKQGEKLFFDYNDDSDYLSTSQTWTVPTVSPDEEDGTTYTFDDITTSDITGFKLLAARSEVSSYIAATQVSVDVPISVSVVNNNITPLTSTLAQISDTEFEIEFSEAIKTPLEGGLESAFKVTSTNGFGAVSSYYASSVEATEERKLKITFDDFVNYDAISVSINYDATTFKIYSDDGNNDTSKGFTAEAELYGFIAPLYFNFLGEADADDPLIICEGWTATYIESSPSEQGSYVACVDSFEGRSSVIKYVIEAPAENTYLEDGTVDAYGAVKATLDSKITPDVSFSSSASYNFKCKIYVESLTKGSDVAEDGSAVTPLNNVQFAFDNSTEIQLIDLTQFEKGKWVEFEATVTPAADATISSTQLRVRTSDFVGVGAKGVFFIDAISLSE